MSNLLVSIDERMGVRVELAARVGVTVRVAAALIDLNVHREYKQYSIGYHDSWHGLTLRLQPLLAWRLVVMTAGWKAA